VDVESFLGTRSPTVRFFATESTGSAECLFPAVVVITFAVRVRRSGTSCCYKNDALPVIPSNARCEEAQFLSFVSRRR
jgi:hypothetical protein